MSSAQQPNADDPNTLADDLEGVTLSPTQRKVAELMCLGYSQSDIASRLQLNEGNLKRIISEIYDAFDFPKEERKTRREYFLQQRLQPYLKATAKQNESDLGTKQKEDTLEGNTPTASPDKPQASSTPPDPNTQQPQQGEGTPTLNPALAGRTRPLVLLGGGVLAGALILLAIQGFMSQGAARNSTPIPVPSPTFRASTTSVVTAPATTAAEAFPAEGACAANILPSPWRLAAAGGAAEASLNLGPDFTLQTVRGVLVTFDLHGLDTLESESRDTATLVFDQNSWYGVTLTDPKYGAKDAYDGPQTITVPIGDFVQLPNPSQNIAGGKPLDTARPVPEIHTRFWHREPFTVDITSIQFCN